MFQALQYLGYGRLYIDIPVMCGDLWICHADKGHEASVYFVCLQEKENIQGFEPKSNDFGYEIIPASMKDHDVQISYNRGSSTHEDKLDIVDQRMFSILRLLNLDIKIQRITNAECTSPSKMHMFPVPSIPLITLSAAQ